MNFLNKLWIVLAIIIVPSAAIYTDASLLTLATSLLGVSFVLCVANRIAIGNLIGAVLVFLFGILSYQAGYYMNAVINILVLFPLQVLAYYSWKYDFLQRYVTQTGRVVGHSAVFLLTAILIVLFLFINLVTNSSLPIHDAMSAGLVIGATLLLMMDTSKQWYLWIPYNLLEVFMWIAAASLNPEVLAILVMRMVFFINSLIGYYNWKQKDEQTVRAKC